MQVTVCNKDLTGNLVSFLEFIDIKSIGIFFFCIGVCNKSGWNGISFIFCSVGNRIYLQCTQCFYLYLFFFVSVVPFFSPNIAGATAAARFPPQASIHFYKISCCVWIFDSKANTKTQQLKRRSHFGFSCILRDKDLWSLWDEKGKKKQKKHPMRQWSHYILSLGMGVWGGGYHDVNRHFLPWR